MERTTGRRSIPTLILDDGSVFSGEDEILEALDRRFVEPETAARHRHKAIEEWPEWQRLADSSLLHPGTNVPPGRGGEESRDQRKGGS